MYSLKWPMYALFYNSPIFRKAIRTLGKTKHSMIAEKTEESKDISILDVKKGLTKHLLGWFGLYKERKQRGIKLNRSIISFPLN